MKSEFEKNGYIKVKWGIPTREKLLSYGATLQAAFLKVCSAYELSRPADDITCVFGFAFDREDQKEHLRFNEDRTSIASFDLFDDRN